MAAPPRPFLTAEQMQALTNEEKAVAVAEWSSYVARLKREQEQGAARGFYRGSRSRSRGYRGRGRGLYGAPLYQPYTSAQYGRGTFSNRSATFSQADHSDHNQEASTTAALNATDDGIKQPQTSPRRRKKPCPAFTATGICKRPRCWNDHDPDKTAICRQFLSKGDCPNGSSCPLSHEPSPNRSPSCIHFQNSHCNKDDCRYAHVHVNVDAPICEAFARLGYCEKGIDCAERHAFECPDFTNQGLCEVKGCRLPHVVHAGRLRKARGSSEGGSPHETDSSENEDETIDDADQTHALTQQADFVPFGNTI